MFHQKGIYYRVFSGSQNLWRQEGPKKTSSKSDFQGLILELHERAKMLQFCHMSLWGRHCEDSLHHCRSLCEQFTLSENWVLVSDLRQIPLIDATRITSATSVCREVRKCHFGFCGFSGFRKRHSRNRIDAQQAIHSLQCKRAGDEHESHHLSDRCYPSFLALVSFKLRQKLQRDKRQRSIPPNLYLSKNGSEYSCGSSDSPSLQPLMSGWCHHLVTPRTPQVLEELSDLDSKVSLPGLQDLRSRPESLR